MKRLGIDNPANDRIDDDLEEVWVILLRYIAKKDKLDGR